jgi:hypothetical protein
LCLWKNEAARLVAYRGDALSFDVRLATNKKENSNECVGCSSRTEFHDILTPAVIESDIQL